MVYKDLQFTKICAKTLVCQDKFALTFAYQKFPFYKFFFLDLCTYNNGGCEQLCTWDGENAHCSCEAGYRVNATNSLKCDGMLFSHFTIGYQIFTLCTKLCCDYIVI